MAFPKVAMASVLVILLSACQQSGTRDVAFTTTLGAVLGTGAGAIIDRLRGQSVGSTATWVGLGLGTAGGAALGAYAAERRRAFQSQAIYIEDEIAAANAQLEAKTTELAALEKETYKIARDVHSLEARSKKNMAIARSLRAVRSALSHAQRKNSELITENAVAIQYIDEVIAQARAEAGTEALQIKNREEHIQALESRQVALRSQLERLYGTQQELGRQEDTISELSKNAS